MWSLVYSCICRSLGISACCGSQHVDDRSVLWNSSRPLIFPLFWESPRNIPESETILPVRLALFHAMLWRLSWPYLPIALPSKIIIASSHLRPLLCPPTVQHFSHNNRKSSLLNLSPWSRAASGGRPMKSHGTPAWKSPSLGSVLCHCILKSLMISEARAYPFVVVV